MNEINLPVTTRPPLPITTRPHTVDIFLASVMSLALSLGSSICCCGVFEHKAEQQDIQRRANLITQVDAALHIGAHGRARKLIQELVSRGYENTAQVDAWHEQISTLRETERIHANQQISHQLLTSVKEGRWDNASMVIQNFALVEPRERARLVESSFDATLARLRTMFEDTKPQKDASIDSRYITAKRCISEGDKASILFEERERLAAIEKVKTDCSEVAGSLFTQRGLWGSPIAALEYEDLTIQPHGEGIWRVSYGPQATLFVLGDKKERVNGLYMVKTDAEPKNLDRSFVMATLHTWMGVEVESQLLDAPKGDYIRHVRRRIKGTKQKVELGFYNDTLIELTIGKLELELSKERR